MAHEALSKEERQKLLLSVGTHRGQRPLSPVEVAQLFSRMLAAGQTLADCARASNLEGTTWVSRFLRLLDLPDSVRHLVDWGSNVGSVTFSSATEIARLEGNEKDLLAQGALLHRLSGVEVRQVVQLRKRSNRSLQACIDEVIGMRPTVERRYLYMGAITDKSLATRLGALSQYHRDEMLQKAVGSVLGRLQLFVTKLGPARFTVVGADEFGKQMKERGDAFEREINAALLKAVA